MSSYTKMPELRRDRVAIITNVLVIAVVGFASSVLWIFVR